MGNNDIFIILNKFVVFFSPVYFNPVVAAEAWI